MYEAGVVNILDPITNEVISHCYGPTAEGGCPLAGRDGDRVLPRVPHRGAERGTGALESLGATGISALPAGVETRSSQLL